MMYPPTDLIQQFACTLEGGASHKHGCSCRNGRMAISTPLVGGLGREVVIPTSPTLPYLTYCSLS